MRYITVTQQNKDDNANLFANKAVGSIIRLTGRTVVDGLPNAYKGIEKVDGGYMYRAELHEQDGFFDYVQPIDGVDYDSSIQYLGAIIFDVDKFTKPILDYTAQEISDKKQQEAISNTESQKHLLIQQKLEEQVVSDAQANDDTSALYEQALFPMWLFPFDYTVDFKCQAFNSNNELKLYKCVQTHTSQSDWQPKDVPALFAVVAYPNEIPVFVQPTGAQDAYSIGDKVHFPTINDPVYESLINANVWSPLTYQAGWQQI